MRGPCEREGMGHEEGSTRSLEMAPVLRNTDGIAIGKSADQID